MTTSSVNLIVLRVRDLEESLRFYRALGLTFVQEQHGSGPVHYACELDSMVVELYPGEPGAALERKMAGATMLGFQVDSLDSIIETLEQLGVKVITKPQTGAWGRRMVVEDPDGRAIDLSQPLP